ncbi:50S ribosomal protein L14 chloroplastic [Bienertia sinuspersici]
MIQPQTHLNVADNSGARDLMCIRIIGASNRQYARIGNVIVAVIKEAIPNMPLERSEVIRVVIVRTRKELKRDNGMIIDMMTMLQLPLIKKEIHVGEKI